MVSRFMGEKMKPPQTITELLYNLVLHLLQLLIQLWEWLRERLSSAVADPERPRVVLLRGLVDRSELNGFLCTKLEPDTDLQAAVLKRQGKVRVMAWGGWCCE